MEGAVDLYELGAADDGEVMIAFLYALTGTQRATRAEGLQPPHLVHRRNDD